MTSKITAKILEQSAAAVRLSAAREVLMGTNVLGPDFEPLADNLAAAVSGAVKEIGRALAIIDQLQELNVEE